MSDFALSHYTVAVQELDEGARTYGQLLGLERGTGGRNEDIGLEWLAMGFAGECSLLLVAPLDEISVLHTEMEKRVREHNPYGEGFYASTWHAGDPMALAKWFASETRTPGPETSDTGETDGDIQLDPRGTHGLSMMLARQPEIPQRPVWPSHIAIAVANLKTAEETFVRGLGLDVERRFEADYGDFKASALYTDGREVLALMAGRSETSAVARRMRSMASAKNPLGEGFYLASWAASDPVALAERVQRAGGLVAWQQWSFFIHPRSTHGIHMRIYPAASHHTDD